MISWTNVHCDRERVCLVAVPWQVPFVFVVGLGPDRPSQGLRQRVAGEEEPRMVSSLRTLARGTVVRWARRFKLHFHDRVLCRKYVPLYWSSIW